MDWKEEYKKAEARMTAFLNKHNGFTISEDGEMFKELSQIFRHEEEIEDEKIRKHLISLFEKFVILGVANECETSEIKVDDILSWLKKQELKKIEQKPTDNVEPKFKDGDWVVNNNGEPQLSQVISRSWPDSKIKRATRNSEMFINTTTLDKQYHLWTIQDAKDGDVLCTKNKCCPFIYDKGRYNNGLAYYYVGIDVSGNLNIKSPHNMLAHFGRLDNIHPAAKEQRDLLFKKMHEAGYEWDGEKKELKKIEQTLVIEMKTPEESLGIDSDTYNKIVDECVYGEQNPVWSEEDEVNLNEALSYIKDDALKEFIKSIKNRVQPKQEWSEEEVEIIDWLVASFDSLKIPTDTFYLSKVRPFLISLRNKIQPIINEWSEEDEYNKRQVCRILRKAGCSQKLQDKINSWLESFRFQPHWKPSDEQITVLAKASETYCDIDKGVLYSLYNDLKKLREE